MAPLRHGIQIALRKRLMLMLTKFRAVHVTSDVNLSRVQQRPNPTGHISGLTKGQPKKLEKPHTFPVYCPVCWNQYNYMYNVL